MKKLILSVAGMLLGLAAWGQKITFDPVDWKADQPLSITFDLTATSFQGFTGDLFLWSWSLNPSGGSIDSPRNGAWTASSNDSRLTNLGNNRWRITFTPTQHFGLGAELLQVAGFQFLLKNTNGSTKSADYGPVYPWADTGIRPNACWSAKGRITLLVDMTGTPLQNSAGPLHYWGWYNTGAGDVGAAQNGTWGASSAQSQMTRVGTSTVWQIELEPETFFGTTANNLSNNTIFGLVKTTNGSAQTGDFGLNKIFKQYQIYQTPRSRVTITPANPTDSQPITVRFKAVDGMVGYTGPVYLHAGLTTVSRFSDNWDKVATTWEDSTSTLGLMTNVGTNEWEYTIPTSVRSFFNLTSGEMAHKLHLRMRTKNGSISEGDGCGNVVLGMNVPYLEVREPVGSILNKNLNETFNIIAYTPGASNFSISVNGNTLTSTTGTTRAATTFTPTTAGTYTIQVSAVSGSTTLTKVLTMTVCSSTSRAMAAALPTGLKHGINYNPSDPTRATLVLHAPTENIYTAHVIGDFNNWTADCNYLMSWDNTKKVFWKEITGLVAGQEYVFQYLLDGKTRIGDSYTHKVSDPWNDASIPTATYPGLIPYPAGARPTYGETPTIASVLQTNRSSYTWQVPNFQRQNSNRLNIYQLHFRDFTTEGTYLAAIQKLDYLKRMGINAIETLPVSEFEGNDSWGYNPNYYFAADKAYGTDNEFKLFVDECHKRGIAVLGDIVLNHAFGTNPMARMYWNDLNSRPESNNPWFNIKTNFDNPGANWGNDFNHTSPHTQAFVDSVIHFWLVEYKIDGIRFDFTKGFGNTPYPNAGCADPWGGCYDLARINLLKRMTNKMWAINNGATGSAPYVIMEHLATLAEDKELADYGISLWSGVAPNYKYSEIAMGYAPTTADPNKTNVSDAYYVNKTFNLANWISYMESHDEERLAYKALAFGNGNVKTDAALRAQFLQSAASMNLLLTGPRQIWQFGELGYDFSINFNGRTGRKPIRWDYYTDANRRKIYTTYAKLFWLRNNLPGTFHRNIDNPGGNKTDFVSQFKRYHFYSAAGDTAVTIVANTANSTVSGNPQFNSGASTWTDFMTGNTQASTTSLTLQPGEFRIFMNKIPTQAPPTFVLTAASISATDAQDTSRIWVRFDKEINRVLASDEVGEDISNANVAQVFELRNASNVLIPIGASMNILKNSIVVDPVNNLVPGSYTLTLLNATLQNYGGIRVPAASFTFTVLPPCPATLSLVSSNNDFGTGTQQLRVSSFVQAANKVTNSSQVTYDATQYVFLQPGFEANVSILGRFEARTGGCN
jgi:glycosidase